MYFNIDEHLIDLKAFEELLPHLSVATRNYFSSNDCFNKNIENNFKIFNPDSFVKKVLLNSSNYDETLQKLRIKVTSLAFYRFLAKNSISFKEDNYSLPFFNDEDKCIEGFNIKLLFLDSQSGKEISRYKWLNSASFVFVSSDYDDFVKSYLKTNFHVRDFSDMIVMNEVILSEDYHNSVETSIKQSFKYE